MKLLATLDGLDGIKSVGTNMGGASIVLEGNTNLISTAALSSVAFPSNTLYMGGGHFIW
jgi:hypothetical protein